MRTDTTRRARFGRWTLTGWMVLGGCGDDAVAVTEAASDTGSGTGTSQGGPSSTDGPVPTTDVPTSTDSGMTDGTASVSTGETSTTTPTTGDTTEGVDTTTTGSTGDTTVGETETTVGETETTTGDEVVGRSVSQTVNAGSLVSSPNFRMVFTLGQPTQNQATTTSPSFKLRGGLVGANGSPP